MHRILKKDNVFRSKHMAKQKERIFLYMMIIYSLGLSAQNNYADFLVQGTRTYWSLTKSVCHPQWNMIETGLCVGADSLFDWYKITDENDTLQLYEGMDYNMFVDHRTCAIRGDTLLITNWYTEQAESFSGIPKETSEAYKILYLTRQKLGLLKLEKDASSRWVECLYSPCKELNMLEFNRTK